MRKNSPTQSSLVKKEPVMRGQFERYYPALVRYHIDDRTQELADGFGRLGDEDTLFTL